MAAAQGWWRRVGHIGAEMLHQRGQAAIEALPHRHEAPPAVLAVELAQHHGLLGREIAPAEIEAREFALSIQQAQAAGLQLGHGAAAVDAGGNGHALDRCRQPGQLKQKAVGVAAHRAGAHAAAGTFRLVEEGHVAVVDQLAAGIQAETGEVERQSLCRQAGLHHAIGCMLRQRQALAS